ncbi:MAG: hypothetical protein JSS83_04950 [Cyanobacteria bacterium SZAS LIN-3]|nr:hypothetical protein [Cyanobacteria bacterium SZAS LIN-3]
MSVPFNIPRIPISPPVLRKLRLLSIAACVATLFLCKVPHTPVSLAYAMAGTMVQLATVDKELFLYVDSDQKRAGNLFWNVWPLSPERRARFASGTQPFEVLSADTETGIERYSFISLQKLKGWLSPERAATGIATGSGPVAIQVNPLSVSNSSGGQPPVVTYPAQR